MVIFNNTKPVDLICVFSFKPYLWCQKQKDLMTGCSKCLVNAKKKQNVFRLHWIKHFDRMQMHCSFILHLKLNAQLYSLCQYVFQAFNFGDDETPDRSQPQVRVSHVIWGTLKRYIPNIPCGFQQCMTALYSV